MCTKENLNQITKEELMPYYRHIHSHLKYKFAEPLDERALRKELGAVFRVPREQIFNLMQVFIKLGWVQKCGKIGFYCAYVIK